MAGKAACGDPADLHPIRFTLARGENPDALLWPGVGVVSAQSFHPTVAGAAVYAGVATATLKPMLN